MDEEESAKNMGNADDSEAELSDCSSVESDYLSFLIDMRDKSHPTHDVCDDHLAWRAVVKNRPDVLQRLIKEKKSICAGTSGNTVLHLAAYLCNVECTRILLNEGACDIDGQGEYGNTPLLEACVWCCANPMDIIKVLCDHKADQRLTNEDGFTALHLAMHDKPYHDSDMKEKLDPKIVKLLVSNGADIEIENGVVPTRVPEYKSLVGSLLADESYETGVAGIKIAVRVLMFQGLVAGTVPLTAVKEVQKILRLKWREHLPVNFKPMKKLYTMAQNPPSLKQLATTKIRRQMTECGGGSFCKEDFQNLEIPQSLKEWVQLAGLGDGSKIFEDLDGMDEIMRGAANEGDN